MPQMAPLLWLPLMMMIILVFCFFTVLNYFFFPNVKANMMEKSKILNQKSWKW